MMSIVLLLCVNNMNCFIAGNCNTGITDLTTTFRIEWRLIEYQLIQFFILFA